MFLESFFDKSFLAAAKSFQYYKVQILQKLSFRTKSHNLKVLHLFLFVCLFFWIKNILHPVNFFSKFVNSLNKMLFYNEKSGYLATVLHYSC